MARTASKRFRETAGGYGNQILYRMCADQPKHDDVEIISSKIWIIGRAYAAAIERKVGKRFKKGLKKGDDFCQKKVAPIVNKSEIDEWIRGVSHLHKARRENLYEILECHKNVTDLFKKAAGLNRRSLASKYLHFHVPKVFFIYDSRANRQIKKIVKKLNFKSQLKFDRKKHDKEYAIFFEQCIFYREHLEKTGKEFSPRMLDMKLLKYKF
jgi:hypothetical protein